LELYGDPTNGPYYHTNFKPSQCSRVPFTSAKESSDHTDKFNKVGGSESINMGKVSGAIFKRFQPTSHPNPVGISTKC